MNLFCVHFILASLAYFKSQKIETQFKIIKEKEAIGINENNIKTINMFLGDKFMCANECLKTSGCNFAMLKDKKCVIAKNCMSDQYLIENQKSHIFQNTVQCFRNSINYTCNVI